MKSRAPNHTIPLKPCCLEAKAARLQDEFVAMIGKGENAGNCSSNGVPGHIFLERTGWREARARLNPARMKTEQAREKIL